MNRRPPKNGNKHKYLNTLLVDGNALLKNGYHGAKNDFNKDGEHVGGIFQFITNIRGRLNGDLYHRVFVFWDGLFSGKLRYELYEDYKSDRGKDYVNGTVPDDPSLLYQRMRIQEYLEDLYIRQIDDEDIVEGDDFIAYFCKTKKDYEKITIVTNDGDLCQLVDEDIQLYHLTKKVIVTDYNYLQIFGWKRENAVLIKTICGDASDSIRGVKGVKEKTLLKNFPELAERSVSLQELLDKAAVLQAERLENKKPPLKVLTNLIEGITTDKDKNEVKMGIDLYNRNRVLVDLSLPMMTEEAIGKLDVAKEGLNPSGRGIKNAYALWKEDGLDVKVGNSGIDYLMPFKKLSEREKNYFNLITEENE